MKSIKKISFFIVLFVCLFSFNFVSVFASNYGGSGGNHSNNEDNNENLEENPEGYDSWPWTDKVKYWAHSGALILGLAVGVSPDTINSIEKFDYPSLITSGYSSYSEFLAANSSYDDNTMTWTFSDDAMTFINELLNGLKDDSTYQYAYFCPVESIDPNSFETKDVYDLICSLLRKYPDKAFSLQNTGVTMPKPNGEYGTRTYPGWNIYVFDTPYAGVSAGSGSITNTKTTLYDDNWLASFTCKHFGILRLSNDAPEGYDSGDIFYYDGSEWIGIHDPVASDFDLDVCNEGNYGFSVFTGISANYFSNPVNPNVNYVFSAHAGGIPVFKSVADMKAGTTGKQVLQTMPGYTGQPITKNTITQQEINDFSTTYNNYYGDNSGNNPGGGSGSGSGSGSSGNWLESLLSSLGKLGDIIMTLLSKVFDIITDILKFFTDTLADVMDIVPEGFIGFLGAFFPFIPEEWLTAVSLLLALTLIGAIIKFFKK